MSYEELKRAKPEIKNINEPGGSLDPRFHGIKFRVPTKVVKNLRGDMALQDLYVHGPLKWPDTGKTCDNCINFYRDEKTQISGMGRCRARGFMRVHKDTPAEDKVKGWTDPVSGISFKFWPACPLYTEKIRLSRR